jgi:GT2 family glycosyltransferase
MDLGIVIPVYNNVFWTKKTIESIIKNTLSPYILIIIDDASTDETYEYIKELGERGIFFYYIKNEYNIGVNASWNKGIKKAKELYCKYIAILNNDLEVTNGWDLPLLDVLEDKNIGIVSPLSTHGPEFPNNSIKGTNPAGPQIKFLGACFAFKSSLIDSIGYIPEEIKYYFGDNWFQDMCEEKCLDITYALNSYVHHYFCQTTMKLNNCYWVEKDKQAYLKLGI